MRAARARHVYSVKTNVSRAACGVYRVQLQLDEELEKLRNLEPSSSEFNVTRNYLDWSALSPVRTRLDRIGSPSCFRLMRPWRAVRSGGRAHRSSARVRLVRLVLDRRVCVAG